MILSNNNTGKAVAPRLSVHLHAAFGSGVSKLPLSINPFVVFTKVYSGNAFAHLVLKTDVKILTLAQNSFELIEKESNPVISTVQVEWDGSGVKT